MKENKPIIVRSKKASGNDAKKSKIIERKTKVVEKVTKSPAKKETKKPEKSVKKTENKEAKNVSKKEAVKPTAKKKVEMPVPSKKKEEKKQEAKKPQNNKAPNKQKETKPNVHSVRKNNKPLAKVIVPPDIEIQDKPSKKMKDPIVHKGVTGEYSEDIKKEYRNVKSKKELDNDFFKKLSNYKKTNEILWGRVSSTRMSDEGDIPYVIVLWNGYEVLIPLEWYFLPEFNFGKTFASSNKAEKLKRMKKMVEYQFSAIVCFTVKGLSWDVDPTTDETVISVIGNRVEAMKKLQDIYFIDGKTRKPIKVGDIINETHVLAVKEENVLVECRGVETRISAYYLNNEFVKNCNDYCKPGDTIATKVKTIGVDTNKGVYLSLTGRLTESSNSIKKMKVGQYITGYVDTYNKKKHVYTINLINGVKATVHQKVVMGNLELVPGDRVTVRVIKLFDNFVVGMCSKA